MKIFILNTILFLLMLANTKAQQIGFSTDTTLGCNQLEVLFNDTNALSGIQYRIWDFADGSTDTSRSVSHTFNSPGIYNVKLTIRTSNDSLSCSKQIIVREKPVANFSITTFGNKTAFGDTLYFSFNKIKHKSISQTDSLPVTYTWIFDSDTLPDTANVIIHTYKEAGEHTVRLIVSAFNACLDSAVNNYTIKDEIFLPNIFTPNSDGINDIFYAQTDGEKTYELTIFSRYGSVVYTITATKVWWDGRTSAGEEVTPGTYFYVLKEINGDTVIKGTVYLSR
jgi:gliding motility-associated-like protein